MIPESKVQWEWPQEPSGVVEGVHHKIQGEALRARVLKVAQGQLLALGHVAEDVVRLTINVDVYTSPSVVGGAPSRRRSS